MTKERRRELKDIVMSLYGVGVKEDDCLDLEECIDKAYEADKYAWHDLRKNPEDLPAVEERVVLTFDLVREYRNIYGHRAKNGAWVVNGFETRLDVIAWRTDEPFEEDNECGQKLLPWEERK